MKMVVLSHSLSLFTPNHHHHHHHHAQNLNSSRNHGRVLVQLRNRGLNDSDQSCFSSTLQPISQNGVLRRNFLLFGLSTSLLSAFPSSSSCAEEALKMGSMVDEINAYSYLYPLEFPSKKLKFKWVESRSPERYSSAAPLSPDARLRIVSERIDFIDNMIISVTIGPPNSRFIKSPDKTTWTAKEVADSVLSDKSALRVTSSQRMSESSVLDTHSSEVDGQPYWYYEYLIRKSPTKSAQDSNNFRHYVAATAERDGYFYTVNASTLNKQWNAIGPLLQNTVASFRLDAPTEEYVPPYKDPWRFW